MLTCYFDRDADLDVLKNTTVAVIGYGNQGRAQALNLRDSGLDVLVGSRPGASADAARTDGFTVHSIADAAQRADLLMILLPDEQQGPVYQSSIAPVLRAGKTLAFGSGFAIHYKQIQPPAGVDVILVAPKGPGSLVRSAFQQGRGVHNLVAVHADASGRALARALAFSKAIGGTRIAAILTTFKDEIETDLFGEQVVLCGGVTELVKAAFDTLVNAGYPPELAYFECLHELMQCTELLYRGGLPGMWRSISDTAEYGAITRGKRIVNDAARAEMQTILAEIRSGAFTREWLAQAAAGMPMLREQERRDAAATLEQTGAALRAMLPR